jgi:hypothetical protein
MEAESREVAFPQCGPLRGGHAAMQSTLAFVMMNLQTDPDDQIA